MMTFNGLIFCLHLIQHLDYEHVKVGLVCVNYLKFLLGKYHNFVYAKSYYQIIFLILFLVKLIPILLITVKKNFKFFSFLILLRFNYFDHPHSH